MSPEALARVLCVDDDEDACEMLSLLLKSQGIDVTCAESAAAAWALIKTKSFDLYLLDSWLPLVDGFEFCRQIRELDSKTPIVFYSGAAYDTDKRKGIAAGANAYLTKPDVEGLVEMISNLIASARDGDLPVPSVSTLRVPAENPLSARFFGLETVSV